MVCEDAVILLPCFTVLGRPRQGQGAGLLSGKQQSQGNGHGEGQLLTEGSMEGDRATGYRAEKTVRTDTPSILPYPVVTKHIGRSAFWPQYACGGPRA